MPPPSFRVPELVGKSSGIRALRRKLERLAPSDVTLLVEGETGTGKELVAEWVHDRSRRARGPFVVFDCGAVASSLIESDLFGHVRGAFTGAADPRSGVLEEADGGTLFLDEIGELPRGLQPKLLRLLERRATRRVGDSRDESFDVRVIAATNRSLAREVRRGAFRQDLYFRIAAARVVVPPLRERLDDLPLLVDSFLRRGHEGRAAALPPDVCERLRAHHWPGNVRELRNVVECFLVSPERALAMLQSDPAPALPPPAPGLAPLRVARREAMEDFERRYLERLLASVDGNVSRAAALSAVSRQLLHRMIRKHGLRPAR